MAYQAVIDTIYRDIDAYQNVHTLLMAQKKNLFSRNNHALVDIAHQITVLLQQTRQNVHRRSVNLDTLELPNTQAGMMQFFDQLAPMLEEKALEQLLSDWKKLISLVQDCKAINRINGSLLQLQKQTADRVLSHLKSRGKSGSIYSRNGQAIEGNQAIIQMKA